jgi:hypothetical protein
MRRGIVTYDKCDSSGAGAVGGAANTTVVEFTVHRDLPYIHRLRGEFVCRVSLDGYDKWRVQHMAGFR